MMTAVQIISAFQSISGFTGDMAEAARTGEWDRLSDLEGQCALVVAQLRAAQPFLPLTGEMQRQKVELIQKIIADDAIIRHYAEPWMERLHVLLTGTAISRKVCNAYRQDPNG